MKILEIYLETAQQKLILLFIVTIYRNLQLIFDYIYFT